MAAFGKAARLIQHSEFARCQSEQAAAGDDLKLNGGAEVDEKSLAVAKQVQTQLNRAMHAALSTSNGFLIIPTLPGPPIQRRYELLANLHPPRCSLSDFLQQVDCRQVDLTTFIMQCYTSTSIHRVQCTQDTAVHIDRVVSVVDRFDDMPWSLAYVSIQYCE